jgi:hypothetical protein
MSRTLPWLAMVAVLTSGVYQLREQGRLWICSCDYVLLWTNEYWGRNTSQHFLDPASFTHLLHGFVLCGLVALVVPRVSVAWRLWLARRYGRVRLPRRHGSELGGRRPFLRARLRAGPASWVSVGVGGLRCGGGGAGRLDQGRPTPERRNADLPDRRHRSVAGRGTLETTAAKAAPLISAGYL